MAPEASRRDFESTVWPHFAAAYNLARWLTRRDADAEDVVQEAMTRALRYFDSYQGGDARAWLLTIVRNTSYTWMSRNRGPLVELKDDELERLPQLGADPQLQAQRLADKDAVRGAIEAMPPEYREVIVLRELEGLSYKEIAEVAGLPIGTVMSRLSRARDRLQAALLKRRTGEKPNDL